jgi:hypothetical protein
MRHRELLSSEPRRGAAQDGSALTTHAAVPPAAASMDPVDR